LEQDAEAAAERFLDAARAAIEYVFRRPRVGTPKVFREDALMGLRSWPVKGFPAVRIYYLASKDEVRIVRVLHGKRDIELLLKDADEAE
jgi:toxin ParE1/3/4